MAGDSRPNGWSGGGVGVGVLRFDQPIKFNSFSSWVM
jgi:hypothetical protein